MGAIADRIKKRQCKKKVWTFEKEAILVRMWYEHQPIEEIRRTLGVTKSAVHTQAVKLRLPRRNKKRVDEVIEQAREAARDNIEDELKDMAEVEKRSTVYDLARLNKTVGQIVELSGLDREYVRKTIDELLKAKLLAPNDNGTFTEYDPQFGARVKKPSTEYTGTQREGNIRRIHDPRVSIYRKVFH